MWNNLHFIPVEIYAVTFKSIVCAKGAVNELADAEFRLSNKLKHIVVGNQFIISHVEFYNDTRH